MSFCFVLIFVLLLYIFFFFFFNDTATTEIYTLSLHDALPILVNLLRIFARHTSTASRTELPSQRLGIVEANAHAGFCQRRSEEHTSELQSRQYLVCRLLLEKKKKIEQIIRLYKYIIDYLNCYD